MHPLFSSLIVVSLIFLAKYFFGFGLSAQCFRLQPSRAAHPMNSVYPPEFFGSFIRSNGEKQKLFSASKAARAPECNASGLFGKQ